MSLRSTLLLCVLSLHKHVIVRGLSMPDCSKPEHEEKPECKCRFPTNWNDDICQGSNWFGRPEIAQNIDKLNWIVGGELAPVDKYPWFARLVDRSGNWAQCGGMLVAPEYVLTAAHCVSPYETWTASQAAVQIGAVCPNTSNNCGQPIQQINVQSITPHPNYNNNNLNNDYALVKLVSRANATPVVMDQGQYVDLYPSSKRNLYAIGFGNLSSGGNVASQLRHVELAFVPRNVCNNNYGGGVTDFMMCAADPGQDSCQGDSGGPLYDDDNNALVGIVSWGFGCADPQYPGVYAQVSSRWTWIKSEICNNHSTPKPDFCTNTFSILPTVTPSPFRMPSNTPTRIQTTTPSKFTPTSPTSSPSEEFQVTIPPTPSPIISFFPSTLPSMIPTSSPTTTPSKFTSTLPSPSPLEQFLVSIPPTSFPVMSSFPTTLLSIVPTSSPTKTSSCIDSPLRFRTFKPDGKKIWRSCEWVATKTPKWRCSFEGVSTACPLTCGTCDLCVDSLLRMRVTWNGSRIARSCSWVENKATIQRCKANGISDSCRRTCGTC